MRLRENRNQTAGRAPVRWYEMVRAPAIAMEYVPDHTGTPVSNKTAIARKLVNKQRSLLLWREFSLGVKERKNENPS